jgi:predicted phosphoribosyltransferase
VAPPEALEILRGEVDETVCLEVHQDFGAIGLFYADFHQISDEEVTAILDRLGAKARAPLDGSASNAAK